MPVGIYQHKSNQGFQKGHPLYSDALQKWREKQGNIPWNKGKTGIYHHTEKAKIKIGEAHKGEKNHSWKGGISKLRVGFPQGFQKGNKLGKKFGNGYISKQKGENHWHWKGGISPENKKIRTSIEYRFWIEGNFARDNYTCQKCGERGRKLRCHHIQNFAQYPQLRFAIDNGITFCEKCHIKFHRKYGIKNNNKGQIKEFLNKEE